MVQSMSSKPVERAVRSHLPSSTDWRMARLHGTPTSVATRLFLPCWRSVNGAIPTPTAISSAWALAHSGNRGTLLMTSAVLSSHSRFRPVACDLRFRIRVWNLGVGTRRATSSSIGPLPAVWVATDENWGLRRCGVELEGSVMGSEGSGVGAGGRGFKVWALVFGVKTEHVHHTHRLVHS